ncbi:MAG: MFS transporter [Acidimicrobiales bacterium]|nr:MFS transporter [Acidimicrobiales bacterium]
MTVAPPDPSTDEPRLITPLFALITASGLFYFMAMGSLLPTLPRYVEDELSGSGFEVGLVVGAFAVSAALVRPVVGRLGDVLGRRVMAIAGGAIAAVSIIPLGLVPAVWFMVVMRLVTGLGEASFFVGAATAAQDLSPDHRRGEAASFFSISIYSGLAFGPMVGEWMYRTHGPNAEWLLAAGLCMLSLLLSALIPAELGRTDEPSPRRGLLHPAAVLPGTVLLLGLLGFAGYVTFVPLYVDEVGMSDAGPLLLAYGLIVLFVRIVGARIPDKLGPVRTSTFALIAISSGVGIIAVVATGTGLWVGTILLSIGMSLLFPALFTLAVNSAPANERSHTVGSFGLFFDLSMGFGAPLLGVLVTVFGGERAAFAGGAVIALVGLVLANTKLRSSIAATRAASAAS